MQHAVHFWLGSQASVDEAGVAALKAVELDDSLGGLPVQYREMEGNETELFLSYFRHTGGIRYLPGGVASGFEHVEEKTYRTKLLHLKGKRTVRVQEVPVAYSSMNQGDVFILDAGLKIYIFFGPSANMHEKAKAIDVATKIDSDERLGKADIIHLDSDPKNADFWSVFGGYKDPSTLPIGASDDTVTITKLTPRLINADTMTDVGSPPFTKDMLTSDMVCLLQNTVGKLFIWIGKNGQTETKRNAMKTATEYMKTAGIPSTNSVERVSEGVETASFIAEFRNWNPPMTFGLKSTGVVMKARADEPLDVKGILQRKAVEDTPVDDGKGAVSVWKIMDHKKVTVNPSE